MTVLGTSYEPLFYWRLASLTSGARTSVMPGSLCWLAFPKAPWQPVP